MSKVQNDVSIGVKKPVIYNMFIPRKKTVSKCSNPYVTIYKEVPPYAVDEQTGEFINKSSRPKIVEVGKKNIDEEIQSYADSVDIYKILEKFALSGCTDNSLITRRVGEFADIVDIPDNINDFGQYVDKKIKDLKEMSPDIAKKVLNENISASDIEKMVQEQVQSALIKAQQVNNVEKKEGNE